MESCHRTIEIVSSLTRMLTVLDLFSRDHTTLTADQIAEALSLTRTTCYRYTHELSQAGLLVSHGGQFMLGPRIIELDHRMRGSDPLINAGGPVVAALADATGATGLLSASYSDHTVNVFEHVGAQPLPMSFGRGTTMPMFRSSTSKVLLAAMSRGRLRRLWERHEADADCRAIGEDWKAFWRHLQEINRRGFWVSHGELNTELAGIAAPVMFNDGELAGCMTLIFLQEHLARFDIELLGTRLRAAAHDVSQALVPLSELAVSAAATAPAPAPASAPARKGRARTTPTAKSAARKGRRRAEPALAD